MDSALRALLPAALALSVLGAASSSSQAQVDRTPSDAPPSDGIGGRYSGPPPAPPGMRAFPLDVHGFKVFQRDSGPHNYYRTIDDPQQSFIRGTYRPGLETVTLFTPVPDDLRHGARLMRWRWRALVLPRGGNECIEDRGDGAANVYIVWKRGLRWYSLKLVWSTDAEAGATCNSTRNPFAASDSVILRSGPPVGVWRDEEVDPEALFRQHFEGGDPNADVPELQGIALLTDGDQTHSVSAADYADFVLYKMERAPARARNVSAVSPRAAGSNSAPGRFPE